MFPARWAAYEKCWIELISLVRYFANDFVPYAITSNPLHVGQVDGECETFTSTRPHELHKCGNEENLRNPSLVPPTWIVFLNPHEQWTLLVLPIFYLLQFIFDSFLGLLIETSIHYQVSMYQSSWYFNWIVHKSKNLSIDYKPCNCWMLCNKMKSNQQGLLWHWELTFTRSSLLGLNRRCQPNQLGTVQLFWQTFSTLSLMASQWQYLL